MKSHPRPGSKTRIAARAEEPSGAVSAPIVFAILVAVVALVAGAAMFLGSDPTDQPATAGSSTAATPSPTDLSLTDEEAIERFRQLDQARLDAFEERELEAFADVFLPGSKELARATKTVKRLLRDRVFMRHTRYDVQGIRVIENNPAEVELEQRVFFDLTFVDRSGDDVTRPSAPEELRIRWTLKSHLGRWLIEGGEVVAARDIE